MRVLDQLSKTCSRYGLTHEPVFARFLRYRWLLPAVVAVPDPFRGPFEVLPLMPPGNDVVVGNCQLLRWYMKRLDTLGHRGAGGDGSE